MHWFYMCKIADSSFSWKTATVCMIGPCQFDLTELSAHNEDSHRSSVSNFNALPTNFGLPFGRVHPDGQGLFGRAPGIRRSQRPVVHAAQLRGKEKIGNPSIFDGTFHEMRDQQKCQLLTVRETDWIAFHIAWHIFLVKQAWTVYARCLWWGPF